MAILSDDQRAIVEAAPDARLLVLAGAGTGKTHVLIERIRHLVEFDEVAPGRELLTLSFTRSVVRELKQRTAVAGGSARLVRPITFDSFATRLLATMPEGEVALDWREFDYDSRIAAATAALACDAGKAAIAEYRHVFVDEIQDLVGVRASLVEALIRDVPGFTLLGDPAQAIYDYQVKDSSDATSSQAFLARVREKHPDLQTVTLRDNYRAKHDRAEEIGALLRLPKPDRNAVATDIAELLRNLDCVDTFDELGIALRGAKQRVAVLCRTNATALDLSHRLFQEGIRHRLQREASERVLPAWLAVLFRGVDRTIWGQRRLMELADERLPKDLGGPEGETIWRLLSDTVSDDARVDIGVFRERVRLGLAPDELSQGEPCNIVVSTIHRSKGLEFDVVFLAAPPHDVEDEQVIEELRVLYVGLSRARDEVWTFNVPDAGWWRKDTKAGDRWIRSPWKALWKTLGFEVRAGDFESMRPFGGGIVDADALATQDYLTGNVSRGDSIQLELVHVRDSEEPIPFYAARHGSWLIAETTEDFGRAFARRLGVKVAVPRWPLSLKGVSVDGLETVLGLPSAGTSCGLGSTGLWLRPRLLGLADLQWNEEDSQED